MQRFSERLGDVGIMCRVRRRIAACRRHRLFEESSAGLERDQVAGDCVCGCLQRGRKPESSQVKSAMKEWFEWARKKRIVIAMSGVTVYIPEGKAVEIGEMMRRYLVQL